MIFFNCGSMSNVKKLKGLATPLNRHSAFSHTSAGISQWQALHKWKWVALCWNPGVILLSWWIVEGQLLFSGRIVQSILSRSDIAFSDIECFTPNILSKWPNDSTLKLDPSYKGIFWQTSSSETWLVSVESDNSEVSGADSGADSSHRFSNK